MTDILGKGPHGPVSEQFMTHYYGAKGVTKKRRNSLQCLISSVECKSCADGTIKVIPEWVGVRKYTKAEGGEMSKYIKIYEQLCENDPIAKDDPRRGEIMAEMRAIHRAKTLADAIAVIDCWPWESRGEMVSWVKRARKLMGVK